MFKWTAFQGSGELPFNETVPSCQPHISPDVGIATDARVTFFTCDTAENPKCQQSVSLFDPVQGAVERAARWKALLTKETVLLVIEAQIDQRHTVSECAGIPEFVFVRRV
jgi:hypothetical protein